MTQIAERDSSAVEMNDALTSASSAMEVPTVMREKTKPIAQVSGALMACAPLSMIVRFEFSCGL